MEKRIAHRVKARVFKGLVVNTLVSGMEAKTLRACDYEKMEGCMMGLARRLLGRGGVYLHEAERRQYSNETVRERLGLTCVVDLMRIRRLGWLMNILTLPRENMQLRAALRLRTLNFGSGRYIGTLNGTSKEWQGLG